MPLLVVVHDLDPVRAVLLPEKQAPLVVDPDAVLPGAVALQRFELVAGRNPQIGQSGASDQEKMTLQQPSPQRFAPAFAGNGIEGGFVAGQLFGGGGNDRQAWSVGCQLRQLFDHGLAVAAG